MAITLEPRQAPGDNNKFLASDQMPHRNATKARVGPSKPPPVRKSGHKQPRLAMCWDRESGIHGHWTQFKLNCAESKRLKLYSASTAKGMGIAKQAERPSPRATMHSAEVCLKEGHRYNRLICQNRSIMFGGLPARSDGSSTQGSGDQ